MIEIGYLGGSTINTLGTPEYVRSFFLAIDHYIMKSNLYSRLDWSIITEILYKRTLPADKHDIAIGTMAKILDILSETDLKDVDWNALQLNNNIDRPSHGSRGNLRNYYIRFQYGLAACAIDIQLLTLNHDYKNTSIRLGRTSIPDAIADRDRPLKEYDKLGSDDLPLWMG